MAGRRSVFGLSGGAALGGAALALALALASGGCAGGPTTRTLSFAQMQSLNPGVTASWLLDEYPDGRVERGPDGRVRSIRYPVTDPLGKAQSVTLTFDANEVLADKRYSGPIIRPPTAVGP